MRDATLTLQDGEFVALVGPTGCGESTLLNVAAGLLPATSGRAFAFGTPMRHHRYVGRLMFQADALLPWLGARQCRARS